MHSRGLDAHCSVLCVVLGVALALAFFGCTGPAPVGTTRPAQVAVKPNRWMSTGGPASALIQSIAVSRFFTSDKKIWAGTRIGLFESNNGGEGWSGPKLSGKIVHCIVPTEDRSGQTVFVGTSGGLLKSSDSGKSWHRVFPGITYAIGVSPDYESDEVVLAATQRGICRSDDGGATWRLPSLNPGATATQFMDLAISPQFDSDQTGLAVSDIGGLYRSTDGGLTWKLLGYGDNDDNRVGNVAYSTNFAEDQLAFAGINAGLLRSTDGGATWKEIGVKGFREMFAINVSPSFKSDKTLLAFSVSPGFIYRSVDAGLTWSSISTAPATSIFSLALSPDFDAKGRDRRVFAGDSNGTGFYRSTDGGVTWYASSTGLQSTSVHSLAVSPDYPRDGRVFARALLGGAPPADAAAVYELSPKHPGWRAVGAVSGDPASWGPLLESAAFSPDFARDRTIAGTSAGGGVSRSVDGGKTWQRTGKCPRRSMRFPSSVSLGSDRRHTLFLVNPGGRFFRSTDWGAHWTSIGATLGEGNCLVPSPNFAHDRTIFASNATHTYKSVDGGTTWRTADSGVPDKFKGPIAIVVSPTYARDRTVYALSGGEIARTSDSGKSWRMLPKAPDNTWVLAVSTRYERDRTLFAGTSRRGVYMSADGGASWRPLKGGLPRGDVISLAVSPGPIKQARLFAGVVGAGVFAYDL